MERVGRFNAHVLACTSLLLLAACVQRQPDLSNQNVNSSTRTEPASPIILPPGQSKPGLGGIKVGSRPMGATVIIISEDEGGGFGRPQVRGATPTTITDLTPGKYNVHLELNGYKAFQKSVDVKADETASISAELKR